MEYKVHFSLSIRSLDGTKAAFGAKKLLLPFVPFIGLRLQGKLGASEPVSSITWSEENQEFLCHIDAYEVGRNDGNDVDLDFLIENAKENGWEGLNKIHEINPEQAR